MVPSLVVLSLLAAAQAPPSTLDPAKDGPSLLGPAQAPEDPAPTTAGQAVVHTAKGSFVIELLPKLAPNHVKHFLKTANEGGYDRTTFHRVIPGGVIQGGDPLTKDPKNAAKFGTGGLGVLKAEFSDRPFKRGTVAAARQPSNKDSGGNQFFVVLTDQPSLAGQYTIFGEVVDGMDVVDAIGSVPVDGEKPKERIEIERVTALELLTPPSPAP